MLPPMALRLVEIMLPANYAPEVERIIADGPSEGVWQEALADEQMLVRVVLDASETGQLIDRFEQRFQHHERFQLLVLPVAAALPQRDEEETKQDESNGESVQARSYGRLSLSRQELNHQIADMAKFHWVYVSTVVLSAIVASIGMLRDNVAVIIGAMVIAPLLGPNIALGFAATVGDTVMIRRALATNLVGMLIALGLAACIGIFLSADGFGDEVLSRTSVQLSDVVLALASGAAGALAITTGAPAALVGVMVAVALLPPAIAVGLMAGTGQWWEMGHASVLLATNVICVNLAAIVTFLVQGIRPATWWEARAARRSAATALVVWFIVLTALIVMIFLLQAGPEPISLPETELIEEGAGL